MSITDETSYYKPSTGLIMSTVHVPVPTREEAEEFTAQLQAAKTAMMQRDFDTAFKTSTELLRNPSLPIAQQVAAHIILGTSSYGQFAINNFLTAGHKASRYMSDEEGLRSLAEKLRELMDGARKEMDEQEGKSERGVGFDGAGDEVRNLGSLSKH